MMERIQVATGQWVVDYEAGIGGEGYDPPKPRRQRPADTEVATGVEQPCQKAAGHTAVAAVCEE